MSGDAGSALVEPVSVIVCDDIRQESNGKLILIGVYSDDIIVPSIPTNIALCFLIQIRMMSNQPVNAKLRVTDPSGTTSGEGLLNLSSISDSSEVITKSISMPALAINIPHVGKISIYWSNSGEDFALIGEKRVIAGSFSSTSGILS